MSEFVSECGPTKFLTFSNMGNGAGLAQTSRNVRKQRGLAFHRLVLLVFVGRDAGIRTRDPLNPIQVRYQTAPRPDRSGAFEQGRARKSNAAQRERPEREG